MIRRLLTTAAALLLCSANGFASSVPIERQTEPARSLLVRVLDREGKPVAGATVRAVWTSEDEKRSVRETTSPEGTARLTGLPPETFRMSIEKGGFTPESRSASVTTGAPREIGITLQPGTLAVGKIVDEDGRPVADAEIELSGPPGETLSAARRARSGPAGRFRFRDLPVEPLTMTIRHDGFATLTAEHPVEGGTSGPLGTFVLRRGTTLWGTVADLAGRPVAGAHVWALSGIEATREDPPASAVTAADGTFSVPRRPPGEGLSLWICADGFLQKADTVPFSDEPVGVVLERAAAIQGRVLDPDGTPRPGAVVVAEPAGGFGCGTRIWSPCPSDESAVAEADGRFTFERLHPGWYDLVASAPGLRPGISEDLRLAAGETAEEQEIRLGRGADVTGRVLDPSGSPIPGAHLEAQGGRSSQEAISGPDGSFSFSGVESGPVQIRATATRFQDGFLDIEVAAAGTTADIVLKPMREDDDPIEVHGLVLGPGGSPVEGALVSIGGRSVSSERDGSFALRICGCQFTKPLGVAAEKRGFVRGQAAIFPTGEHIVEGLEIRLETGTTVSGRVLGLADRDLRGVPILFFNSEQDSVLTDNYLTDTEGKFRLGQLAAGTWEIQAFFGNRRAREIVTLEPGQLEAYVELAFTPGQQVSGRILDPDGLPAAHATLSAFSAAGESLGSTWTHADGTFSLEVPAGEVTLFISDEELRRRHTVQVGDGPVTGLEIRLERGALLTGRLLGLRPDGESMIMIEGPTSEFAQVDPDGSWSVRNISPGTWELQALHFRAGGVQELRRTFDISRDISEISIDLDFTDVPITDPDELP